MSEAAVIIPVYKPAPERTERMSLERCVSVLGSFPVVLAAPASLDCGRYFDIAGRLPVERFPDGCFRSVESYSALLLAEEFYGRFDAYEYILIYQLDAFVFSDQLVAWCAKGYDYIGAPWLDEASGEWTGVGNGGFSLRRVAAFLEVLRSRRPEDAVAYWDYVKRHTGPVGRALRYHRKLLKKLGMGGGVKGFIRGFAEKGCPEDMFWGLHARRFLPSFRVAPVEDALHFAIEGGIMKALPAYSDAPPFGCHRKWFLDMLYDYLYTDRSPTDGCERSVWGLAGTAGMNRIPENV